MDSKQGIGQAGTVLLLVGAILSAVGAVFMLLFALGFGAFVTAFGGGAAEGAIVIGIYVVLAVLLGLGTLFGFLAWGKAKEDDANGAFVFGLIASFLPPLQVIPLLGAIFCKVDQD